MCFTAFPHFNLQNDYRISVIRSLQSVPRPVPPLPSPSKVLLYQIPEMSPPLVSPTVHCVRDIRRPHVTSHHITSHHSSSPRGTARHTNRSSAPPAAQKLGERRCSDPHDRPGGMPWVLRGGGGRGEGRFLGRECRENALTRGEKERPRSAVQCGRIVRQVKLFQEKQSRQVPVGDRR